MSGKSVPQPSGFLDELTCDQISGWAFIPESRDPATVSLRLDDAEFAAVSADLERPALKRRDLHPTGRCGFSLPVDRDALRHGGLLTAVIKQTGQPLANARIEIAPRPDLAKPIVYCHIPKTAGTSLRKALEAAIGGHRVARDYGPTSLLTSRFLRTPRSPGQARDFMIDNEIFLLSGHFPAERYWSEFGRDALWVTLLRDPVKRVISSYEHACREIPDLDFEQYVKAPRSRNLQSRVIGSRSDEIDLLGFTEGFADTIAQLESLTGLKLNALSLNRSRNPQSYDESQTDLVRKMNRRDIALYRSLRKRYSSEVSGAAGLRSG